MRTDVHRAWWVAAVTALVVVAAGACATTAGLLVTPMHREFGWSHGTIGIAVSVNMVLYGLTAPFSAALVDRFGIRRTAAGALSLIAAGAAITTAVSAPWQLIAGWGVLVGIGCGGLATTFAATVAHRWFAARRGLVTGALTAATVVGQFAFLPVMSWVIDRFAWRSATIALALIALAATPLAWSAFRDHPADLGLRPYGATAFEPKPRPEPGAARRTLRVLLDSARTGPFWLLAGTFAICGASTNGIMWTHFASAAHDHGMPTTIAASVLAIIGVVNVAGTVASGWLTDRFSPRLLLAAYYGLRGTSLLFLPSLLAPTVQPGMIAFAVLFGLLDVATVPPTIALCREIFGADGAIVFGWVSTAHQLGAGLVALGGGVARDLMGTYDAVWISAAALCAMGTLLAAAIRKTAVQPA
ncbi:Predicted arabinose efflux permease, MFS family [Saccharopolyspora antimicrobica]|uniref:MFS family arabinose efflux permease n=1 Tax=Saccharopolyspora antimicrobica TaxID=455193 RepID=A0A1I5IRW9_9PSEU|nr:MFS transporter [Saccharopolyspora antimicrobica]RKT84147.1 putative MFS family arabinose efflux permease [Saccharopolyspora antimicrobica]SFO63315.1 Predicted arabinose efflux permease, MFS family [Saccharopolyspora antimicrobica]